MRVYSFPLALPFLFRFLSHHPVMILAGIDLQNVWAVLVLSWSDSDQLPHGLRLESIKVMIAEGIRLPTKLVGADPILDLALIRILTPSEGTLPIARLGDSDQFRVGEAVLAISNPMGIGQTMTRGIISAIN